MRDRSALWKKLAARGKFRMDSYAKIGGVSYTAISAPCISRALVNDDISVGNCVTASLTFSVLTDDVIAKGEEIEIISRLVDPNDDTIYTEWKTFGIFYITKRTVVDNLHTFECYDSMMKANALYVEDTTENRAEWPKTMTAVVAEIADRLGVGVDSRNSFRSGNDYLVQFPAGLTMKEVLEIIAAANGGNFIITPDNDLRLVTLVSPPAETFNILDYDYNKLITPEGYKLVWKYADEEETLLHTAGGGLINVPVVIGALTTGKTREITRITMSYDENIGYTAGNDTGETLRIEGNPYTSSALTNALYSEYYGLIYSPFTAETACYDPATELGDWVIITDKVRSVLFKEDTRLDVSFRANISAPAKDETDSEYPFLAGLQRAQQKADYAYDKTKALEQNVAETRESVLAEVNRFYASKAALSELNVRVQSIALSAQKVLGVSYLKLTNAYDNDDDSSRVAVALSVQNNLSSSTISLTIGGVTVASEEIRFSSMVTPYDFSHGNVGIDGSCITSGLIDAQYLDIDLSQYVTSTDMNTAIGNSVGTLTRALAEGTASVDADCISGALDDVDVQNGDISGCSISGSDIDLIIDTTNSEVESDVISFVYKRSDGSVSIADLKAQYSNGEGLIKLQALTNNANIISSIALQSQKDISLLAGAAGDIYIANADVPGGISLKNYILGVVSNTY